MKVSMVSLSVIVILFASSTLLAGDFVLYGGAQKAGKLTWSGATGIPSDLFDGDFGGTFGARFSAGRAIGFEQNLSYTSKFGKPGVKAFQADSNLLIQAPGKIVPYVTAGVGLVTTWGQEMPSDLDPAKIAAFAFNIGTKFTINYGGGIKVRRFLGPVGLNIDVRGYTIPNAHDTTLHIIQTSAGLVFTW
ncbi:MAG TPA: hypothetical protein VMG30_15100 [Acidobacteriota bacterium]|nr:hypothetical protein [Acidobacteriota bacterium]